LLACVRSFVRDKAARPAGQPADRSAMAPPSRDYWLGFFRGAGDNVFDAIDAAITVAASDHPAALRERRDGIAERLFTALLVTGAAGAGAAAGQGGSAGRTPVPSLCSSDRAEAVTDDGAPRGDDPVLAETERIKAVLLGGHDKVPHLSSPPLRTRSAAVVCIAAPYW
jgi:hypothetical protein